MRNLIHALAHRREYVWWALRPWRRHSLVLLVAGVVYVLIGLAYTALPTTGVRGSALRVALAVLPLAAWGIVFIVVGALAIVSSRWPPASETWGYTAMSTLSTLWACFYAFGIALGAPVSNTTGALLWAVIAFLWWAISGLVNPDDMKDE